MDEEKQELKAYSSKNLLLILYYGNVTKVKKLGINSSKKPLLITDRQILFFNSQKRDPCLWLNIKSLKCNDKQIEIMFEEKKEIIFSLPKGELLQVFGIIVDLLRRILTKEQKEYIQLNKYLTPHQRSLPSSGFSLISRFLGNADIHSMNGKIFVETLQALLMIQSPTISNIYFPSFELQEEVTPLLLDLLPFIRSSEHFQIVNCTNSFQILTKFITNFDNIVHLSISTNQDKENLSKFITELKSGTTAIEGIDFSATQFEEDEFISVCKAVKSLKMCSFGLNSNSISKKYLKSEKFYDDFETNNYLIYLNFSKFFNLNFSKISPKIRNISILSVSFCNIEVNSIFQILKEEEFPNLSEIDISGNVVSQQISPKNVFPPNLSKIIANKIEWKNSEYLRTFFSFIFKKMNSILHLSVSEIAFSDQNLDENWDSFFQYLSLIDAKKMKLNSIVSFCWDGNKVSSEFFDFLSKCKKLESLSLSYCFKGKSKNESVDEDSVSAICDYLKSAKTIKKLIIRGSEQCKLRTFFSKHLIKSIEEMKSLKQLDVSDNSIGDEGINSLKNLIKKMQQYEIIVFDNSDPQSLLPILNIFSLCMKLHKSESFKTKLSFPIRDIYSIRDAKKVQKKDLKMLKSYCQCMLDQSIITSINSNDTQIPFPKSSPLDRPFFTYYSFHMSDEFQMPKYIKRGTYHKTEIPLQDESDSGRYNENDYSDHLVKKKKDPKAKPKQKPKESDSDSDEKSPKKKKNYKKVDDTSSSDSDSSSDSSSDYRNLRLISKRRKSRVRDDTDEEEEESDSENARRKKGRRNVNKRKNDGRSKNKKWDYDSDDDSYSDRKYVKNKGRGQRRRINRNEEEDAEEEEERLRLKKKSYDDPIDIDTDDDYGNQRYSPNKSKKFRSLNNNDYDEGSFHKNTKKNLAKSTVQRRNSPNKERNSNINEYSDDDDVDEEEDDENNNNELSWTFPFQPVPIPADNNAYIESIDDKYSIVSLTSIISDQ